MVGSWEVVVLERCGRRGIRDTYLLHAAILRQHWWEEAGVSLQVEASGRTVGLAAVRVGQA